MELGKLFAKSAKIGKISDLIEKLLQSSVSGRHYVDQSDLYRYTTEFTEFHDMSATLIVGLCRSIFTGKVKHDNVMVF